MIVNSTLSNNHVGISVILDAVNVTSNYVEPEVRISRLNFFLSDFADVPYFILYSDYHLFCQYPC